MRDYAKASPRFWTGDLGRSLRGDPEAQAMAWYLITAPGSNMVGLYHLPIAYAAADLGSPLEGASKALRRVCEVGLAVYDEVAEVVWVKEALRHEVGESIKSTDHKVKAIRKILLEHRKSLLFNDFRERYGEGFAVVFEGIVSSKEAPSKPLVGPLEGALARAQEQEQEQEQEKKQKKPPPTPQGEIRPASRKPRQKGRKIPNVEIPEELAAIGIDASSFALRVNSINTKPASSWQTELDRLVPMVAEAGASLVMETWEDAIGGSWQGCTPSMVRDKARRNAIGQRFNHENAAGGRRPDNDDDVGC